jgi:NADH:ubiquinone oxidoreductase subunit 3 (subunit A)
MSIGPKNDQDFSLKTAKVYDQNALFSEFFPGFENLEYFKIFTLFIFIFFISILLFGIAYFLSLSTIKDSEKLSQYECGFEPFDEATRHPFDVHFYVVGILFLIFDVEIALLFP